jgi:hypothetical protein
MQPFTSCVKPVIKPCLWIILWESKQHAAFHPPVEYLSSIHAYGSSFGKESNMQPFTLLWNTCHQSMRSVWLIFWEIKKHGAFHLLCMTVIKSMLLDQSLGKKAT